jgi:hypothetical protein
MMTSAEQPAPAVDWGAFDEELDQLAEALARLLAARYWQLVDASQVPAPVAPAPGRPAVAHTLPPDSPPENDDARPKDRARGRS